MSVPASLQVARREWRRILRAPHLVGLLFGAPLVIFTVLGFIYVRGAIVDLPIAVVDADGSALSRTLVRAFDATRSLRVDTRWSTEDAARDAILRGKIEGAIVLPHGLEAEVKAGRTVYIPVLKNTANLVVGNLILKDAVGVTRTVSAGVLVKRLRARGLGKAAAMNMANPIRVESQSLYNPSYNYLGFLVPGLLPVMLQMIIMLAAAVAVNAEFSEGTIGELVETARGQATSIVIGKSLPYLFVFGTIAASIPALLFPALGIPMAGSPLVAALLMVYFVAACFYPAFLISCAIRNTLLATSVAVFLTTPAFIFSGYTFPLEAMPGLHRAFAAVLPFTPFLQAFVKIYQYGLPAHDLLPELLKLSAFLWPAFFAGALVLEFRIKRMSPVQQESILELQEGNFSNAFPLPRGAGASVAGSFLRELQLIVSDRSLLLIVLIAPVFYGLFYSSIYVRKGESEVPVVVVDADRTALSRTLIRNLDAHQMIRVTGIVPDAGTARTLVQHQDAYGMVYVPEGFQRGLKRGRGADVKTWVDASRFLVANDLNKAFTEVTSTIGAGVRLRWYRAQGLAGHQALEHVEPVRAELRSLFSSTETYGDFLLPGLLALILQQTLLIGLGLSIAHEREWEPVAGPLTLRWATGKVLFFLVLFAAYAGLFFGRVLEMYALEVRGSVGALVLLTAFLLVAVASMTVFVASFFRRQVTPLQFLVLTSYPFFLLSGYSWPAYAMPSFLRDLAQALPITPFMQGFVRVVQMGASLDQVRPEMVHLIILAALYSTLALLRIRRLSQNRTGVGNFP